MEISLKTHSGRKDMPVVLLIHGLGMNNYFWVDPRKCHVLGGLAPLTIFLADAPDQSGNTVSFGGVAPDIQGLWGSLEQKGFSLASWAQQQPLGPIRIAVAELKEVMAQVRILWPGRPLYLVGHSRGGLIARRYLLEEGDSGIGGLVTICSPHSGTDMAKFSRYLKPAGAFLEKIIPDKSRTMLARALGRLSVFLQSPAIEELAPEAEFIASLLKPLPEGLHRISFGGTSPSLFQLVVRLPAGRQKIIRFPDMLFRAVPSDRMPAELTPGLGDALVSAESARLAGARHYDLPANHVRCAFDRKLQGVIAEFLGHED